jgi:Ca2+-binding EF-hand superfamily protein
MRRRHVSTGQLFSYMDSDRSDTITLKEFEHGIAMSGVRPMPNAAQIQGLFESFDLNGDGSLSWHEVIWRLEEEDTLSSEEGSAGEAEEEEEESVCQ